MPYTVTPISKPIREADAYPQRSSHFAHRYTRLLTKTCAAQEIGHIAFTLCVVIAHQEDAKRYRGAVSFYNEQLMPLVGVSKWEALDKARQRATDAGWLHYTPGNKGKRLPGRYWVTIPADLADLDDAPCDESQYPANGDRGGQSTKSQYPVNGHRRGESTESQYPVNGHRRGERGGDRQGDRGGELPVPCPFPIPENLQDCSGTVAELEWLIRKSPILAEAAQRRVEPLPAKGCLHGVFHPLTVRHLQDPCKLVAWHQCQLTAIKPVIGPTEAHLLLVIATAMYATKIPEGRFGTKRKTVLSSSRMQWPTLRSDGYKSFPTSRTQKNTLTVSAPI